MLAQPLLNYGVIHYETTRNCMDGRMAAVFSGHIAFKVSAREFNDRHQCAFICTNKWCGSCIRNIHFVYVQRTINYTLVFLCVLVLVGNIYTRRQNEKKKKRILYAATTICRPNYTNANDDGNKPINSALQCAAATTRPCKPYSGGCAVRCMCLGSFIWRRPAKMSELHWCDLNEKFPLDKIIYTIVWKSIWRCDACKLNANGARTFPFFWRRSSHNRNPVAAAAAVVFVVVVMRK